MMRHRASGSYPTPDYYGGGYSGGGSSGQSYGGYGGGNDNNNMHGNNVTPSPSKYNKSRSGGIGGPDNMNTLFWACIGTGLWALIMMLLWWNASSYHTELKTLLDVESIAEAKKMILMLQEDMSIAQERAEKEKRDYERKQASTLNQLERDNRYLQKERDELRVKYEGPDKKEEETRMLLREEAFRDQLNTLIQATKKESKRSVLER